MAVTRRRAAPARKAGSRPTATTKLGDSPSYKNWLVVGDTGVGKTVLASTAPKAYFWTFEVQGTESAKVFGNTDADELVITTRDAYQEALEYMQIGSGCDDYEWLIIDSTSEMEECFWKSHLRAQRDKKPSTRSLYKPALDDYPIVWNQTKAAIDDLNQLPINVLYTAQIMPLETVDEDGEVITELLPALGSAKNGILARKICGKVSMVGYLEPKSKTTEDETVEWRRLYVSRRGGMHAKNRYGWGPYVDNPTIPALVVAADSALAGTKPTTRTRRTAASRRRRSA
jgi:hypothetical protein